MSNNPASGIETLSWIRMHYYLPVMVSIKVKETTTSLSHILIYILSLHNIRQIYIRQIYIIYIKYRINITYITFVYSTLYNYTNWEHQTLTHISYHLPIITPSASNTISEHHKKNLHNYSKAHWIEFIKNWSCFQKCKSTYSPTHCKH